MSLSILTGPSGGTLPPTTATAVSGVVTFNNVVLDTAGSYVLQATSGNLVPGDSDVTVVPAAPIALVITTQPPNPVQAGVGFGFQVGGVDPFGNASALTGTVTVAFAANPGGGVLGGSNTANVTNGVASFTGLTIDVIGSGYKLQATSGGLTAATTAAFTVDPGPEAKLAFAAGGEPPASVAAGQTFPLTVDAEDQFGNLATTYAGTVSIVSPTGVMGTTSVNASGGVATFTGLSIDTAGTYTLKVQDAAQNTVTSSSITVTPDVQAAILAWTTEPPAQVQHLSTFGAMLAIEDQYGNLETGYNGSVTVALDSNPTNSTLGGTTTVTASGGKAAFSGLTLSNTGGGETLQATGDGLTSPASSAINVTPIPAVGMRVGMAPPSTVQVAQDFGLTITIYQQSGAADPDFNGTVTVSIAGQPGTNTLGGVTTVGASNGVATFSDLTLAQVGTVNLQVSSSGLGTITTGGINVTASTATQLVLTSEPPSTFTAGTPFSIQVQAEDQYGNLATGYDGTLTASLSSNSGARRSWGPRP